MRKRTIALWIIPLTIGVWSQEPSITRDDGVVTAMSASGEVIWQNTHDRKHRFPIPAKSGCAEDVVALPSGDLVYVVGTSLFQVRPASGEVIRRTLLPGRCRELRRQGDAVLIVVGTHKDDRGPWKAEYELDPDGQGIPFFPFSELGGIRMARDDALAAYEALKAATADAPEDASGDPEAHVGAVDRVDAGLAALATWDPTNPWFAYYRGVNLNQAGRIEEAMTAFRSALDGETAYDFELLPMANLLDAISPELGDEAYKRGLRFLLVHGYEPEMVSSLLGVATHLGRFNALNLDPDGDLNRWQTLGERLWDFAPRAEWASGMYQALASRQQAAGHDAVADLWRERADATLPYRHFGFGNRFADLTGKAIQLMVAAWLAAVASFLVKFLTTFTHLQATPAGQRWNPFNVWTRGEIAGFLLVLTILVGSWYVAGRGITFIANTAALPLTCVTGNTGHPESVAHFAGHANTDGGRFVFALALQKAGDTARAEEIYRTLDHPRALNNVGVILYREGRTDEANALFQEALKRDPDLAEAAFNLGHTVSHPRTHRAVHYQIPGPLLAMASLDLWGQALSGPFRISSVLNAFDHAFSLSRVEASPPVHTAGFSLSHLNIWILALLSAAAIAGILSRRPLDLVQPSWNIRRPAFVLHLVIPGTARKLHMVGPPVLALFVFSLMAHLVLMRSGGTATDILEAISMPSLEQFYGVFEWVVPPSERWVRSLTSAWWIIWMINAWVVCWPATRGSTPRS